MTTNFHTEWVDGVTLFSQGAMTPAIDSLDQAISMGLRLRSVVGLADAPGSPTAAQMINSGIFTITPTAARNEQVDTAANIIAALPSVLVGLSFDFTIINTAAFDVTLYTNTGVTLVGNMVVNNASATFRCLVTSATTVSIFRL